MSEVIGSISVVASINTKEYDAGKKHIEKGNNDLEKSSDKSSSAISSKWSKAFSVVGTAAVAGFAAASAATISLVTSSVKSFAEYEQLVGGVETLFKKSSDTVMQYADNAYQTAGISANRYMETITGFSASLLQGLGGDTEKAAKIGNQAVTDMADNANKMGTSIEAIQYAYQGFAKDNFTMLDNLKLGFGGSAGEMARLVNESKVMNDGFEATAENVKDIPFDKLIEAIHVTQTQLGITGTTAKEASTTISGSFSSMQASWQNLITGMADPNADIGKLLDNFIKSAQTFGKNLIPAISRALDGVVSLVDGLAPEIIKELPKLLNTLLPKLIDTSVKLLVLLVDALLKMLPTLIKGFVQLITGLAKALPTIFRLLVSAILIAIPLVIETIYDPQFVRDMFTAGVELFIALVEAIPQITTMLINQIPTMISTLITTLTDPVILKGIMKAGVVLFGALVLALPQVLSALFSAFAKLLSQLWSKLRNNFMSFGANFGKSIGESIRSGINSVLRWIGRQVNGIVDTINNALRSIDDIIPGDQSGLHVPRVNIPMLANGGVVSSPTLAMIGEGSESEAVMPLSVLDDMVNGENGAKTEYNINQITISSEVDGERWLRRLTNDQEIVSNGLVPQQKYMGV